MGCLRKFFPYLRQWQVFHLPHIDFHKAVVLLNGKAMKFVDGFRCAVGTGQGAGVDGVQMHVPKPQSKQVQLLFPRLAHCRVITALKPAGQVSHRLAVTDHIQGGHHGFTPPVNSERD